jgi:hypothetical protein
VSESHVRVAATGSRWDGHLEIIIAVVLGLAAVAGAFAAYKREGHEHEAQGTFTRSANALTESTAHTGVAQQKLSLDSLIFVEYMTKSGDNADFLHRRVMDPRLRRATDWWIDHSYARAGNTPFDRKNPKWGTLPDTALAIKSRVESQHLIREARDEQNIADSYTRVEIVLATALFLLGVAGVTRQFRIRLGALGVGLATFVGALGMLVVI